MVVVSLKSGTSVPPLNQAQDASATLKLTHYSGNDPSC